MVFDGTKWRPVHMTRVGARHSKLSNIHQGGVVEYTEYILAQIFGEKEGGILLQCILDKATNLTEFIAEKHPNEFIELAMDFLISPNGEFCIAELNTKPGAVITEAYAGVSIPKFISNPLDIQPDEMDVYQKLILKHGNYIANGLITQNESIEKYPEVTNTV